MTEKVDLQPEIEKLSQELGQLLLKVGWTVTTAESCTGGGISAAITEIAGSSAYFNQAFVTYSNHAKQEMVMVSAEKLDEHGAVSKETVEAMAAGAAELAEAEVSIAVSGIAGPGGGTAEKPVGTVWIGIDCMSPVGSTVYSQCFHFEGDRKIIRQKTIQTSLLKALEIVNKNN